MYIYYISLLIFIISRLIFWSRFNKSQYGYVGSDGYYSLLIKRNVNNNNNKYPLHMPNCYPKLRNVFRPLPIYFLCLLPEKLIKKYSGLFNSIIDILYFAFIIITYRLFISGNYEISALIVMSIVFIFLPTVYGANARNNINFLISWRVLGKLLVSIFFLISFSYLYLERYHILLFIALSVIFIAIYYSSTFGIQCVVFGLPVFCLLNNNFTLLLIIPVCVVIISLISIKELKTFVTGKIIHYKVLAELFKHNSGQGTTFGYKYRVKSIYDFFLSMLTLNIKKIRKLLHSTIIQPFVIFPVQIPVAFCLYLLNDPISFLLLKLYITSIVLFLFTTINKFRIFGEAERYIEFIGYFPIIVGIGYVLNNVDKIPDYILILTYLVCTIQVLYGIRIYLRHIYANKSINGRNPYNVSDSLANILNNKRVFPISFSEAWNIAYSCKCDVLYPPITSDVNESLNLARYYPYPETEKVNYVCLKYNIDYIVINKYSSSHYVDLNSMRSIFKEIPKIDNNWYLFIAN